MTTLIIDGLLYLSCLGLAALIILGLWISGLENPPD